MNTEMKNIFNQVEELAGSSSTGAELRNAIYAILISEDFNPFGEIPYSSNHINAVHSTVAFYATKYEERS